MATATEPTLVGGFATSIQLELDSMARLMKKLDAGVVKDHLGREQSVLLSPETHEVMNDFLEKQIDDRPKAPATMENFASYWTTVIAWKEENQRVREKVVTAASSLVPLSALRERAGMPEPLKKAVDGVAELAAEAAVTLLSKKGKPHDEVIKWLKGLSTMTEQVAKNIEGELVTPENFSEADCSAVLNDLKGEFDVLTGKTFSFTFVAR